MKSTGRERNFAPVALFALGSLLFLACQTHPAQLAAPDHQGTLSFVFDDGFATDYTVARQVFAERGVRCGIAVTTGWTGTPEHTSVDELRKLKADGFEIMSHTVTHPYLARISEVEVDQELRESKQTLDSWGLPANALVYPYNQYNDKVREIAAKYYVFARAGQRRANYDGVDRFGLFSYPMSSGLDYCKEKIDEAAKYDGWIFLYHHELNVGLKFDDRVGTFILGEELEFSRSKTTGLFARASLGFFGSNFIYNPTSDVEPLAGETITGKSSGAHCTIRNVVYNDRLTLERVLDYVKVRWPLMKVLTPSDGFRARNFSP